MKKYLYLMSQSPFQLMPALAGFDMTLATTAFEQLADLLFLEEGIWQIAKTTNPSLIGQKSINQSIKALP